MNYRVHKAGTIHCVADVAKKVKKSKKTISLKFIQKKRNDHAWQDV